MDSTGIVKTVDNKESSRLLSVSHLTASYEEFTVVRDVTFDVDKAEIVCIVGESGSGKSTLIKAIHGMSGLTINEGAITYCGRDLGSMKASERRKLMGTDIALIPQDPGASFNPIRRLDVQFKEALESHGMDYDEGMIEGLMAKIGLKDGKGILKNRPYEMSGGMNQRIAIAAAMMFEPRFLMCDEATSALDVSTAGAVVNELMKVRDELGTAILMVTHHLGIAKRMADRIGIMKEGRIIELETAEEIFRNPQNDYTKALIQNVPRLIKE